MENIQSIQKRKAVIQNVKDCHCSNKGATKRKIQPTICPCGFCENVMGAIATTK